MKFHEKILLKRFARWRHHRLVAACGLAGIKFGTYILTHLDRFDPI
jgi:hypothetical protein